MTARTIVAVILVALTLRAASQEQPVARYAFISPIIATNTGTYRNQVRSLATGIRSHLVGIDENGQPTSDPELAVRFVLARAGVPLSPQIEGVIYVGWHPNVAENIRDRYFDLQFRGLNQIAFFPPPDPMTEQFMIDRMKQFARESGADRFWLVRPGDTLTTGNNTELLAKFVDF
jgi:hypothetical protein